MELKELALKLYCAYTAANQKPDIRRCYREAKVIMAYEYTEEEKPTPLGIREQWEENQRLLGEVLEKQRKRRSLHLIDNNGEIKPID